MKRCLFLAIVAIISVSCLKKKTEKSAKPNSVETPETSKLNTLFKPGEQGYACFRIPAVITTNNGSVIAFSEARKSGCSDTGDIDLVMKKSTDNGVTWSALQVIWDDNDNVCGNPAPVLDTETGTVHLLATWNNGKDHESEIINGTSIDSRLVYQLTSIDDGQTWSEPKNITASVKKPNWTWYATGPVHSIQLKKGRHKGRLVIPCDHIEKDTKKYFSHVFYSDDHGVSWKLGGTTPSDQVNECTVAELSNGDLLLNMRNYNREAIKSRQIAISKDGGDTWVNQKFDTELPEPRCQGALLSVKNKAKNILLFTNPADSISRVNMTLSVSFDEGLSWDKKLPIYPSYAAYSDLTELKNGNILVLYEAGEHNPYEGIHYKIISKNKIYN
ncbi:sialidase family protein [Hwangdonia lutea]|uniref:exo-alpha-sialidase n=1 Tax=Hwangdonia lutea TaxID=3075823 RepID=A0AA97EQQ3_9FLAO|nr:sialidase family protein [Hwangdonia sp. SCSIO 19198]WOD44470.1 sialidase family protein [Hwangdonia sp. SCSIO 19198]